MGGRRGRGSAPSWGEMCGVHGVRTAGGGRGHAAFGSLIGGRGGGCLLTLLLGGASLTCVGRVYVFCPPPAPVWF